MSADVPYAVSLIVDLHMLSTAAGGVNTAVSSGYRPLCQFTKPDGDVVTVGMCQLELADVEYLEPGGTAKGVLRFAPGVEDMVRDLAELGPDIELTEGTKVIGSATIQSIE